MSPVPAPDPVSEGMDPDYIAALGKTSDDDYGFGARPSLFDPSKSTRNQDGSGWYAWYWGTKEVDLMMAAGTSGVDGGFIDLFVYDGGAELSMSGNAPDNGAVDLASLNASTYLKVSGNLGQTDPMLDLAAHGGIHTLRVTGDNKIGFYDKAPVALQTGVAVNSAGIHAALVNLGLITA